MRKILICIRSYAQLLLAIQIRLSILKNDEVSVLLDGDRNKRIFENRELESVFCSVFWVRDLSPSELQKCEMHLFPKMYLHNKCGVQIDSYSDIFFWNPTWVYYCIYIYVKRHKKDVRWHLIADGIGTLYIPYPNVTQFFKNNYIGNKLNKINQSKYCFGDLKEQICDIYLWGAKYTTGKFAYKVIDVDPIEESDVALVKKLNAIFVYEHKELGKNIIYIDTARDSYFRDEDVNNVLCGLIQNFGEHSFILRKHPRVERSAYKGLEKKIDIMDAQIPWELYCLNSKRTDIVLVGNGSSAMFLPLIALNKQYRIVLLDSLIPVRVKEEEQIALNRKKLYDKIMEDNSNVKLVCSIEGLIEEIPEEARK